MVLSTCLNQARWHRVTLENDLQSQPCALGLPKYARLPSACAAAFHEGHLLCRGLALHPSTGLSGGSSEASLVCQEQNEASGSPPLLRCFVTQDLVTFHRGSIAFEGRCGVTIKVLGRLVNLHHLEQAIQVLLPLRLQVMVVPSLLLAIHVGSYEAKCFHNTACKDLTRALFVQECFPPGSQAVAAAVRHPATHDMCVVVAIAPAEASSSGEPQCSSMYANVQDAWQKLPSSMESAVRVHLDAQSDRFVQPAALVQLPVLPRLQSNKLDRQAVAQLPAWRLLLSGQPAEPVRPPVASAVEAEALYERSNSAAQEISELQVLQVGICKTRALRKDVGKYQAKMSLNLDRSDMQLLQIHWMIVIQPSTIFRLLYGKCKLLHTGVCKGVGWHPGGKCLGAQHQSAGGWSELDAGGSSGRSARVRACAGVQASQCEGPQKGLGVCEGLFSPAVNSASRQSSAPCTKGARRPRRSKQQTDARRHMHAL